MIHGTFDFFFASAGGGNGADDVDGVDGNGADGDVDGGDVTTIGVGGRAASSPVVRSGGCSAAGDGGGGLTGAVGGSGGVAGREMSDVSGDVTAGPVVGPVLRGGNATVAG